MRKRPSRRTYMTLGALVAALALYAWGAAGSALAASPWWHLSSNVRPANIAPGGEGTLTIQAANIGTAATTGPETVRDVLPPGFEIVEGENFEGEQVPQVSFFAFAFQEGKFDVGPAGFFNVFKACDVKEREVSCVPPEELGIGEVKPYEYLEIVIKIRAEGGPGSGTENLAEVSGGGAQPVSLKRPVPVSEALPSFGVEAFSLTPEEEGGAVDARAGSHPSQLTTTVALNQNADPGSPPALARNLQFNLPPGLIGNATAIPQCSDLDFRHIVTGGIANQCPADTAIGAAVVTLDEPHTFHLVTFPIPLFNLVPRRGEPARFGFEIVGSPVTLDTAVRTGSDYGVTVTVSNITQLASFVSSTVSFWGVPGEAVHDSSRGWGCIAGGHWGEISGQSCVPSSQTQAPPFLTLPTSCEIPFTTTVQGNAWPTKTDPSGVSFAPLTSSLTDGFGRTLSITGCNKLPFEPSIEVQPDGSSASTPTGLTTRVRVPQEVNKNGQGLASSSVRDIEVSLPEGVNVNPAGAGGLEACAEGEIGYLPGESAPPREVHFTPTLPSPFCPDAAKIGTAKIKVPVIQNPLEGAVYLAAQNANPFGSLVAMYIVAEDPVSGVLIKLPGEVSLSEAGHVSASFRNSPQAPFEEAELHFFGGSRAPLSTPPHCGTYTTNASFTPWSGEAPVSASSHFDITSGPNGTPCPSTLPFAPALAAGTTNIQAGAFSALTTTISREDGNQDIQGVQLQMPPGLSGVIAGVPLCPEDQANAGSCSPQSEIGHTTVSVGLGGDPFTVVGGQVFLTASYKGAPYGLSIVNPAKAGPFDLGKVIVRAKLEVDPHTAALKVTTDAIPHTLDGIPLQIKHVNVTVDRPGFTFNPTNCAPLSLTGTITSTEGAAAPVASAFQVSNCRALKFAPKFVVKTTGKNSKARGAGLNVKLTYPKAPLGTYANLAKAKVSLPKQLPSRLTTLQKACTSAAFEQNPASCPKESIVGHAKVITPVLPVPLEGPAYFVSHGGEAFPDLTIVLSGYGVTVDLVGSTQIKNGVTTSTFKATPDVPFTSFELNLPQGPYSALTSNVNLCTSKLTMPTEFTAQNGALLTQTTPISVSGCPKPLSTKQKLAKALKACHKKKRAKRAGCERQARQRYVVKKSAKRSK